jgi:hypothetical protein
MAQYYSAFSASRGVLFSLHLLGCYLGFGEDFVSEKGFFYHFRSNVTHSSIHIHQL